jgi:hypothetical protein
MLEAGPWAKVVIPALWRIARRQQIANGDITAYWAPIRIAGAALSDLALWSTEDGCTTGLHLIQAGMDGALRAGLVDNIGGRMVIHDWDDYYGETSTERVRKHRARKQGRNGSSSSNVTDETVSPVSVKHGKQSAVTAVTVTPVSDETHNRQDKTRQDKSRIDKNTTTARDPTTTEHVPPTTQYQTPTTSGGSVYISDIGCPVCSSRLHLIRGSKGTFYGHGKDGGADGCRKTVTATDEHRVGEKRSTVVPRDQLRLCSGCGEWSAKPGETKCDACKADGAPF